MTEARDTIEKTYHHGDLKSALLAAARAIVEEEGAEAFTLREAARRAGVSHGAPAHHFGDKTGLLTELAAELMNERIEIVEQAKAAAGDDPIAQLKACGLAHIGYLIAHPKLDDICWRENLVDRMNPALQAALQRMTASLVDIMSAVTGKDLLPEKEANPSTLLAISVVNGFAQLVNERIILRDVPEPERTARAMAMADEMLDMIQVAFGERPPQG